jgi:NADH-quinone oxidoreductase subunit G
VVRITARENQAVNQWWICDRGRGGFHGVHDPKRLTAPSRRVDGASASVTWNQAIPGIAQALREIIARHGASAVAVVASAELTNEECFLANAIFREGLKIQSIDFPARLQEPVVYKRFTIEGDRNPNARGAATLGLGAPPDRGLKAIMQAAAEGKIRAMVFLRGGPLDQFGDPGVVARALGQLELLVVMDAMPSAVSERAHWVLPGVSFAERDGSYTNSKGRVQRARKVFTLRGDTREDWRILQDLGRALGVLTTADPGPEQIFQRLSLAVPAFGGLSYSTLGESGAPLASATADVGVG